MVSPVNNGTAIQSLLRSHFAQTLSPRNNPHAAQAIIDQLQKTANASTVAIAPKTAGTSGALPRGSLVDVLA